MTGCRNQGDSPTKGKKHGGGFGGRAGHPTCHFGLVVGAVWRTHAFPRAGAGGWGGGGGVRFGVF